MAQDYDKLLKEILREVFPAITEKVLGIQAKRINTLPFDLQYTTELKTDQLYKPLLRVRPLLYTWICRRRMTKPCPPGCRHTVD